jgi:hypothetical protein
MTNRRRRANVPLLVKLRRLHPARFEQLTFDLLTTVGLRNAEWRTPGADGGRDIQGVFAVTDLSETTSFQSWYVECKRYGASVDWPTVRGKLAYAENHSADFLLIVTTGHLSPTCKEEIHRRERRSERPRIRYWDAAVLEPLVARHSHLLIKYRLIDSPVHRTASILPLVRLGTKLVQSAHASSPAPSFGPPLECAAAVMDLISARLSEAERDSQIGNHRPFQSTRDLYPWVRANSTLDARAFDAYALRALLSGVRFYFKLRELDLVRVDPTTLALNAMPIG